MAGPYGSAAKPVRLDPYRNIVEVHWRDTPRDIVTYLAVVLRVMRSTWSLDIDTAAVAPGYWGMAYPFPPPPASGPFVVKFWDPYLYSEARGWEPSLFGTVVNDLPDYGTYEPLGTPKPWYWPPYDTTDTIEGYRWRNPAGGAIMPLPMDPSMSFLAGPPSIDGYVGGDFVAERMTLALTTAATLGRTFNFVGAAARKKHIPGANNILIGGPGDSIDFEMWLLFQYDPPTA